MEGFKKVAVMYCIPTNSPSGIEFSVFVYGKDVSSRDWRCFHCRFFLLHDVISVSWFLLYQLSEWCCISFCFAALNLQCGIPWKPPKLVVTRLASESKAGWTGGTCRVRPKLQPCLVEADDLNCLLFFLGTIGALFFHMLKWLHEYAPDWWPTTPGHSQLHRNTWFWSLEKPWKLIWDPWDCKMSRQMVCRCVHVLTFGLKSCPQVSSLCNTELCNTFMSLCFERGGQCYVLLCFPPATAQNDGLRPLKQQRLVVPRGMQFDPDPYQLERTIGETLRMTFLFWFLLAVSLNPSFFQWFRY